jgi:small subunit ribosomal protein S16
MGARHNPFYRVVVADSESPRDGAFIEIIGTYNPLVNPEDIKIEESKAMKWLEQGAQPTVTAYRLLEKTGVIEKFKNVHPDRKFRQAFRKTSQKQKKKTKATS